MKILTAQQALQADRFTIQHEPISSLELMERAAKKCAEWIGTHFLPSYHLKIFCGMGNNGADGLVIARHLADYFDKVSIVLVKHSSKKSPEFEANFQQLPQHIAIFDAQDYDFGIAEKDLLVDAIFGAGLSRKVEGIAAQVIEKINALPTQIIAIDMPSGLFAEQNDYQHPIVKAKHTLSIGTAKLALLYDRNYEFVGNWELIDIGLHAKFMEEVSVKNYLIDLQKVIKILRKRKKTDHKGKFGHALLSMGSYGKMGAAILAALACLRSGVGKLTVHVPECGYGIMQHTVPEAMVDADSAVRIISDIKKVENYDAIGIGCGIGKNSETVDAFRKLLKEAEFPLIIDADALNILGEHREWLKGIPANSILTPHPKEFERISGRDLQGYERHLVQIELSVKYGIYIVLKGAYTCISCPDGSSFFNTSGNPGMATAGSGDVLAGILTGLLAQGYDALEAALLGVYLHGLAGNLAAKAFSQEALIARDLIDFLGKAFSELHFHTDKQIYLQG